MTFRPPLANHPRLGALMIGLLALLIFGGVIPWLTHEAPRWPTVIGTSLLLGLFAYVNRTLSARVQARMLLGVCLLALVVYGAATVAYGIPRDGSERFYWAIAIAVPVAGLALAWRMLQRPRANG